MRLSRDPSSCSRAEITWPSSLSALASPPLPAALLTSSATLRNGLAESRAAYAPSGSCPPVVGGGGCSNRNAFVRSGGGEEPGPPARPGKRSRSDGPTCRIASPALSKTTWCGHDSRSSCSGTETAPSIPAAAEPNKCHLHVRQERRPEGRDRAAHPRQRRTLPRLRRWRKGSSRRPQRRPQRRRRRRPTRPWPACAAVSPPSPRHVFVASRSKCEPRGAQLGE